MVAAAFPGQAILMSRIVEVFELKGSELAAKGDFFALMFLVLGLGALVVYFIIGWSSNAIAQVRGVEQILQILTFLLSSLAANQSQIPTPTP